MPSSDEDIETTALTTLVKTDQHPVIIDNGVAYSPYRKTNFKPGEKVILGMWSEVNQGRYAVVDMNITHRRFWDYGADGVDIDEGADQYDRFYDQY